MNNEIQSIDPSHLKPDELVVREAGRPLVAIGGRLLGREEHPYAVLYTRYTNEGSRKTAERSLATAVLVMLGEPLPPSEFPWWMLRRVHTQELRSRLSRMYAATTTNKILSFVRQQLDECFDADLMSADEHKRARRGAGKVRAWHKVAGRYLERREREAMRATCAAGVPIDLRDNCALRTFEETGLRRIEASRLDLASYVVAADDSELHIVGKGDKPRVVPVNAPLRTALDAWLVVRGDAPGALFYAATVDGRIAPGQRLSYSGMQKAVLRRAKRAGVAGVALHDFRRTLISDLFDQGVDIATIARVVGHEDPRTTARYDRRGDRATRAALEKHGALALALAPETEDDHG